MYLLVFYWVGLRGKHWNKFSSDWRCDSVMHWDGEFCSSNQEERSCCSHLSSLQVTLEGGVRTPRGSWEHQGRDQDRNPWSAGGNIPAVNGTPWGGARAVFKWNIIKEEGEGKLDCNNEKCEVSNPDLLQLSRYWNSPKLDFVTWTRIRLDAGYVVYIEQLMEY